MISILHNFSSYIENHLNCIHREIIYRGAISSQLGQAEMTPLFTSFILGHTVPFFVEDDILLLQFRMHMVYQNYDFMNLLQPVFFSSLKSNLN